MDDLVAQLSSPFDNNNNDLTGLIGESDLKDLFGEPCMYESNLDAALPQLYSNSTTRDCEFRCVSMDAVTDQDLASTNLKLASQDDVNMMGLTKAGMATTGSSQSAIGGRQRELEIYDATMNRLSDIRLRQHPDEIFKTLITFLDKTANSFKLHERKFKINAVYITEDDRLDVKFAISQASQDEFVLEITRKKGDSMEFYRLLPKVRSIFQGEGSQNL